jgi:hypothetical protein
MCYHFADQAACFVFPDGLMSLADLISQRMSEPLFVSYLILSLLRKPLASQNLAPFRSWAGWLLCLMMKST